MVGRDLNILATLLQDTNRFAEAEPLFRRVLAIDAELNALNGRIVSLFQAGKYGDALPLAEQYLAGTKSRFGENAVQHALALSWIAQLLQNLNRLAEAEPIMRRVIAILEENGGETQAGYLPSLNNLAGLLYAADRFAEAETVYRCVIAIYEKSEPEKQPNYAGTLSSLALVLLATSQPSEAELLMRRALAIDEKGFGPNILSGCGSQQFGGAASSYRQALRSGATNASCA